MILLVTHYGTPLLVVPSQALAPPRHPLTNAAGLTADATRGMVAVGVPPGLFGASPLPASGFPPEAIGHLQALPGVWCVATDPTGAVLAEWPAVHQGAPPDAVRALFPTEAWHPEPGTTRIQAALADGVYAVMAARTWPPGTSVPPSAGLPAGIGAAVSALARLPGLPTPPAGGFYGTVATRLEVPPERKTTLATRLETTIEVLRSVVVNAVPIGEHLLTVLDCGLELAWAAPSLPSSSPPMGSAWTPSWGWDWATRSILLPPGLPSALDPAWLATALYAAHASLNGSAVTARLAAAMIASARTRLPTVEETVSAAAAEAGRAWLLAAEVAQALYPGLAEATPSPSTLPVFKSLEWAARLLPASSDTSSYPGYEAAIHAATAVAAATVRPTLQDSLEALHAEAVTTAAAWHDPKRLAKLPFPPRAAAPQRALVGDPGPDSELPFVCSDFAIGWPDTGPEILCVLPSPAAVVGFLTVYSTGAAGPGSVSFSIASGVRVYLADLPPAEVRRLSESRSVTLVLATGGTLSPPQMVEVRLATSH